jgi:hypothetical protein
MFGSSGPREGRLAAAVAALRPGRAWRGTRPHGSVDFASGPGSCGGLRARDCVRLSRSRREVGHPQRPGNELSAPLRPQAIPPPPGHLREERASWSPRAGRMIAAEVGSAPPRALVGRP